MKKNYGPVFVAVAATLWALDGVLRVSLYSLLPIIIVFYEHLIGSIVSLPVLFRDYKKLRLTKKTWGLLALVALLSGVLGTLWFTTALLSVEFIPFSVVLLLQKLQPIFAISLAAILLKENITKDFVLWASIALVAAFLVTFPNGQISLSSSGLIIGALYAVLAAAAWGSSTVFSKMILKNNPPSVITSLRFLIATCIAFAVIMFSGNIEQISSPTFDQIIRLFLIALSTGFVALAVYYKGLKHTEVKVSTIVELIFPMLAVFIDIVLFDTVLAWSQYAAAGVLVFAIVKVSRQKPK